MAQSIHPMLSLVAQSADRGADERYLVLEEIAQTGSVTVAAMVLGLSEAQAWDAVHALNNLFPRPMIVAARGRQSSAAFLTEEGLRALAVRRLLQASFGEIMASLESAVTGDPSLSFPAQSLLWSPMMKTSARNSYYGTVTAVEHGAVNAEIALKISDSVVLTAIITEKSVSTLGIAPGTEAYALIKASTPILIPDDAGIAVSARNRIAGTVISVEKGAVNSEVILDIGDGKTLCVIVTDDSTETLAIAPGQRLAALIKASQIILALA